MGLPKGLVVFSAPSLMNFIGIDLAWGNSNPTGLAHLVSGSGGCRLVRSDRRTTDEEIIGDHLQLLRPHIGIERRLDFDETEACTTITKGYFDE